MECYQICQNSWCCLNFNTRAFVVVFGTAFIFSCRGELTHKQLETYGCVLSTVATNALMLKHQVISIHNAEWISMALNRFIQNH